MLCMSVSYKRTPVEMRQKFSFSESEQKEFLKLLIQNNIISGGVILSTCNRSELYATVNSSCFKRRDIGFSEMESGKSLKRIEEFFSEYKGLSHNEIRRNCLFYQGKQAVIHLYKVVCGLDSMVIGEDEILHQAKEAYQMSQSINAADGELNILFQGAFNCAKLSKAGTQISETPVSIGTLTANCIAEFVVDKGCSDTDNMVLVIGAGGQIGSIVAKDLIAKGISVVGTTRRHASDNNLWRSEDMHWIDFESRYDYIDRVHAIVSATKSPHYTLTCNEFNRSRIRKCDILLIDLSVPYDIDRDLEASEGIELIGIDHFRELSEKNCAVKLDEAKKMKEIVSECVEEVLKRLYIRNFQQLFPEREDWFSKMIFYLRNSLDSDTLLKVLREIYCQERRD